MSYIKSPAAAITFIPYGEKAKLQPILFTNRHGNWLIESLAVSHSHEWPGSSQRAEIVLIPKGKEPVLPDVSEYRGGNCPHLDCDDSIQIFMGSTEPNTPIDANLLDTQLLPVFHGIITSMNLHMKRNGYQLVIEAKDYLHLLANNHCFSYSSLSGNRSDILLDLVQQAINGHTYSHNEEPKTWRAILGEGHSVQHIHFNSTTPHADLSFLRISYYQPQDIKGRVRFNRYTRRPPIRKSSGNSYSAWNRPYLDLINFLLLEEEKPSALFTSPINGDLILAPITTDTSGFEDPNRFYRSYYLRQKCHPQQIIHSFRDMSSTTATFNHFSVLNSSTNSPTESTIKDFQFKLAAIPKRYSGRTSLPCRNQIIFDDNLFDYESPAGAAAIIAMRAAESWNKDSQMIEFSILADPSLALFEGIRINNNKEYRIKEITHKLNKSGFLTTIKAAQIYDYNPPILPNGSYIQHPDDSDILVFVPLEEPTQEQEKVLKEMDEKLQERGLRTLKELRNTDLLTKDEYRKEKEKEAD